MTKHKVCELEGALLDAAVAKAEGHTMQLPDGRAVVCMYTFPGSFAPSTDWRDGGPIIEREGMRTAFIPATSGRDDLPAFWAATLDTGKREDDYEGGTSPVFANMYGPTPLIAAMRAFVVSRFGEEVDLP